MKRVARRSETRTAKRGRGSHPIITHFQSYQSFITQSFIQEGMLEVRHTLRSAQPRALIFRYLGFLSLRNAQTIVSHYCLDCISPQCKHQVPVFTLSGVGRVLRAKSREGSAQWHFQRTGSHSNVDQFPCRRENPKQVSNQGPIDSESYALQLRHAVLSC